MKDKRGFTLKPCWRHVQLELGFELVDCKACLPQYAF